MMPVILSTCEKITEIVYDMKGTKDGNYQSNLLFRPAIYEIAYSSGIFESGTAMDQYCRI